MIDQRPVRARQARTRATSRRDGVGEPARWPGRARTGRRVAEGAVVDAAETGRPAAAPFMLPG
jgi:hypothetical protein